MTTPDPRYRPVPYETAYQGRVLSYTAPCPTCLTPCHWTATALDGALPHCTTCQEGETAA